MNLVTIAIYQNHHDVKLFTTLLQLWNIHLHTPNPNPTHLEFQNSNTPDCSTMKGNFNSAES